MEYVQQDGATSAPAGQHDVRRLSIVLGISLLCLTIGIATPGWMIYSFNYDPGQYGLFYYVRCINSTEENCKSGSYIKNYVDQMKEISDSDRIELRRQFCLDVLRLEIGAVLAWLLCLISFVILLVHRQSKQKDLIDYWLALASALSVAGIIMGETIYVYLVETDAANRYAALYEGDVRTKLGFPYAMVAYMIGCILVFISVALMSKIFKQEVNALRLRCNSNQPHVIN